MQPTTEKKEDICDYPYVSPAGFSMIFDGVGHNDSELVKTEFPFYKAYVHHFERFVLDFDANQTIEDFKEQAQKVLSQIHCDFHDKVLEKYKDAVCKNNERWGPLMEKLGKASFSKEEFLELVALGDLKKLEQAKYKNIPNLNQLLLKKTMKILRKNSSSAKMIF